MEHNKGSSHPKQSSLVTALKRNIFNRAACKCSSLLGFRSEISEVLRSQGSGRSWASHFWQHYDNNSRERQAKQLTVIMRKRSLKRAWNKERCETRKCLMLFLLCAFSGYFSRKPCSVKNVRAVLVAHSSPNQPLVHFCFIPDTETDLANLFSVWAVNRSPPPSATGHCPNTPFCTLKALHCLLTSW